MNITFLIGNGFDLNLGLDTNYKDFIEYYQKLLHDREELSEHQKEVLTYFKKTIESDKKLWSNAEKAVGQSTKRFKADGKNAEDFSNCHEDFCINLADYLKRQENRIRYTVYKDRISNAIIKAYNSYLDFFRETEKTEITNARYKFGDGFIYNFINFNYTKTLMECINNTPISKLGKRRLGGAQYENRMGKSIHIHGTVNDDMVFGVHDETQISDISLFNGYGDEYVGQIIKSQTDNLNRRNTYNKAHDIIKESHMIYIYGMSIGETDKLWWNRICAWLVGNENRHLIIHAYSAPQRQLIPREYITFEKKTKADFLSYSSLNDAQKQEVSNRIHIDGSNIFEGLTDLVKISEKEAPKPEEAIIFPAAEMVEATTQAMQIAEKIPKEAYEIAELAAKVNSELKV